MGHTKRGVSLVKQVNDMLLSKIAIGQSKYNDKALQNTADKIYSYSTLRCYIKHCCYFARWCKAEYGCKTLGECREHINAWLDARADLSPYTRKLDVAAVCKLYGITARELQSTPVRHRSDIQRSRGTAKRDKHFSEARNAEFVTFCQNTGLRRSEITYLRGNQLMIDSDGRAYIITKGKGGKIRKALIIGTNQEKAAIITRMRNAGTGRVWEQIPNAADIHRYRADYAAAIYKMFARDVDGLQRQELYVCRKDLAGVRYDKKAMEIASKMLGHNRISVIAGHYLYGSDTEDKRQ